MEITIPISKYALNIMQHVVMIKLSLQLGSIHSVSVCDVHDFPVYTKLVRIRLGVINFYVVFAYTVVWPFESLACMLFSPFDFCLAFVVE